VKLSLRRISAFVLMMAVSFLAAGLLGELIIRATMKDKIVLFPRYHTDVVYGDYRIRRFRPNSKFVHTSVDGEWNFEINAQGFRSDRDYAYAKRKNTLRILALGDSHTAGYEVAQNESYSAVLEAALIEKGISAEVLNTGISGFGTAEQLVFLENEGMRYQPDIVIVGFYANDLEDNLKSGLYSLQEGNLVAEKKVHAPGVRIQNLLNDFAVIRWLSENSYFFSFTFNAVYEIAKNALSKSAKENVVTEYAVPVGDITDYAYSIATALIEKLSRVCKESNAKLIILDIPVPTKEKKIVPSVSKRLRASFTVNSDALVDSRIVLAPLIDNGLPVHAAHGHQHISSYSHQLLALAIAVEIEKMIDVPVTLSEADSSDPLLKDN